MIQARGHRSGAREGGPGLSGLAHEVPAPLPAGGWAPGTGGEQSATGGIRRHPDIRLLRRAAQIAGLLRQQERLLAALWPLLAPGGTLVYATCSVLCEENDAQIGRFVASRGDVRVQPIEAAWGRALRCGRQVLPGEEEMAGFYYALLGKG